MTWPSQGLLEDFCQRVFPDKNLWHSQKLKGKVNFPARDRALPKSLASPAGQGGELRDGGGFLPSSTPVLVASVASQSDATLDHSLWCHMLPSSAIFQFHIWLCGVF